MPYWKRKNSRNLYGRVWDSKAQAWTKDKSLRVRDERAADSALRQWERDLADPAVAAARSFTLKEALDGFGRHLTALMARGECASATVRYHSAKAGPLLGVLGEDLLLSEIGPATLEAYRTARHGHGVSSHCITKELRVLRYAMRIAKLAGKYSGDLQAVFPRMATGYTPRSRSLPEGEVLALLWAASPDIGAQIAFSIATSAEAKAILGARREDIGPDLDMVHLRGTKRQTRRRDVPIVTALQRQLIEYARDNAEGKDGLLFAGGRWGLSSALRRLSKSLGMAHVTPNDLRRTFAVRMRQDGVALELIAPLMGHADTTMVQKVYGRLSPRDLAERVSADLNARASYSAGAGQRASQPLIPAHSDSQNSSKMEPTAGVEPATYGLRNPMLIVDYTVNPHAWRIVEA